MSISDSLKENRIVASSEGVAIKSLKYSRQLTFRWCDISRVIAYKIDMFTFDQVRVCFQVSSTQSFEISEDDDGFQDVMVLAETLLPNFPKLESWMSPVVAEPFARSETVLWPLWPLPKTPKQNKPKQAHG